ncbi:hypothetical protein GpartN1_g255.t1 [Galdieria partita]|uniref:Uncharacterized protein n=1 Tax=Galdieria partita TaxID=83374 RepID=A0A9C7PQQ7_9RHOD|nr:hypothetical protein GpartN1_g255.t1 [Galdieria partita]
MLTKSAFFVNVYALPLKLSTQWSFACVSRLLHKRVVSKTAPIVASSSSTSQRQSQAIPFLKAPPSLDGTMIGDVGFDPLGFSNIIDLRYLRESELKHCRIAMLAVVGFIVQEFIHLPGDFFSNPHPMQAIGQVPISGWIQIFLLVAILEMIDIAAIKETLQGNREPGYFGFDPLGFAKDKQAHDRYLLSELKNGRLAMIASIAFMIQSSLSSEGIVAQLTHFKLPF